MPLRADGRPIVRGVGARGGVEREAASAVVDDAGFEPRLLEVENLRTHFLTPRGRVRAVDGVTLSLARGRTLGVVGESGSGKTIFSRSVMNLLPKENVVRSGSVRFAGRELVGLDDKEMRKISGAEIAMIFQDPMRSLNPVMTIGKQITESLRLHLGMGRHDAKELAVTQLRAVNIPEAARRFDE